MKIAVIFPASSEALFNKNSAKTFGGASVQMYNIAKELSNYKNIKTYSFVLDYPFIDFKDKDKFNLIKTYRENDNFLVKAIKMHKTIEKKKPEVIIQHGLTEESCLLAKYCKFKGIKFIFMFAHDVEVNGRSQSNGKKIKLFKLLLKNSYKIITQNTYQKQYLKEEFGVESKIIHNGFEIPRNDHKNSGNILWVARCDKWKRPELFLDLAEHFNKEKFVMVCPKSADSHLFNNIRIRAESLKNVEFHEFVPMREINNYFSKAKLFINTSDYEGFPQTFIQATMYSTPILSLNSNPDEFLDEYKCGFCAKGDFNKLIIKIKKYLTDSKLYNESACNAFHYAKQNHDIKKNVKELLGLIYER